jgi:moderate conductance mechanosensitive channel
MATLTGAIAPLSDFSVWARGNLLVIVLLILGAILFTRFADWARDRIMAGIDARATDTDELVRSEAAKHRHVVAQVVTWCVLAAGYTSSPCWRYSASACRWRAWWRRRR